MLGSLSWVWQNLVQIAVVLAVEAQFAKPADAAVEISSQSTQNMSCTNGVCSPTGKEAVLNVGDLETMLASGNVAVTTTGTGVQARDVDVKAALAWSSNATLALDAYRSINIENAISVQGVGGLSLTSDDGGRGGALSFVGKGRATFASVSSALSINGAAYTVCNSVQSLAATIASDPSGNFALAADYDASADGTYTSPPIPSLLTGTLEGLGNAISHLRIKDPTFDTYVAMFSGIEGTISDLTLADVRVHAEGDHTVAGGLVALNDGTLVHDSVSGFVSVGGHSAAGGLVGANGGLIVRSLSSATVTGRTNRASVGGLVGTGDPGSIDSSYASGTVVAGDHSFAGGLIGAIEVGAITNSYATGSVAVGESSDVGGFVGQIGNASLDTSYSTGAVQAGKGSLIGGFAGDGGPSGYGCTNGHCYWDTTTGGTNNAVGGGNSSGITGLTTQQFQSGLPNGFDPSVWKEKNGIDDGFPYLIANPPSE